jgi:sarcosine oxidase
MVGTATANALSRRETASVVLLEQFHLGHTRGSSHGTSRIFRLNYPDEGFVRFAQRADAVWGELEDEHGGRLIERVGSLDLGPVAEDVGRALTTCRVRFDVLDADEIRTRWPIRVDSGETAVYQPDGGFIHAERAYRTLVDGAIARGVEVRCRTPVGALASARDKVRLSLDDGELEVSTVVVTAGAWSRSLLSTTGIELSVVPTRETVVYLDHANAEALPSVIDYGRVPQEGEGGISRAGRASYALAAPPVGLKAGVHHSGPPVEPDADDPPDEQLAAWVTAWAAARYETAGRALASETCLYTNTRDEAFVLERHGRIVVGSACSGHGFKFAPLVGRTLAQLALDAVA